MDALRIFEHDKDTDGIILIGEIGGSAELEAAAWIEDYNKRTADPKPISALVAGVQASERADPSKRAMGHVSLTVQRFAIAFLTMLSILGRSVFHTD